MSRFIPGCWRLAVWLLTPFAALGDDRPVDYLRDVKPILEHSCFACHAATRQESGLRLDTGASVRQGGDSGSAVVAGNPQGSLLIQAVSGKAGFRMPPEGEGAPLSAEQVRTLSDWIAAGAESPADEPPQTDPRTYWSYQPVVQPDVPTVASEEWVRTPMDAFVAARHAELGLTPTRAASREVWLRRAYLDLIGLPPTREELHAFLADSSGDAHARVVDHLLARQEYGERWGRHWMDVWRYSDWYGSRGGNEIRYSQRHIWRWRDWIVDSLNADQGYDRMLIEMLAGDELAPTDPDTLRATGFIGRNWYKFDRNVWMFETVEHTAQAFLGLTLRCARCHDHKYDPISQQDYYRFRAFFEPHDVRTDALAANVPTDKDAKLGPVLTDGIARVYDKQLDAPTYVFRRGDDRQPDESNPLTPAVPEALGTLDGPIQPVALPFEAYYPSLKPVFRDALPDAALQKVATVDTEIADATSGLAAARAQLAAFQAQLAAGNAAPASPAPALQDDFEEQRGDVWQIVGGDWGWEGGKLTQKQVTDFATIVTKAEHPPNFRARLKYRTLEPGMLRSVGISFDYVDQGNSQDVYTSTGDEKQSLQAFHRTGGNQVYPAEGTVGATLRVGDVTELELEVRASRLTLALNGERKLEYVLPMPRRAGKFALWVHNGSAEFDELMISPLTPTVADHERDVLLAEQAVERKQAQRSIAGHELAALQARIAAELAKHTSSPDAAALAHAACRAEREVAVASAFEALLQARHRHDLLQADISAPGESADTPAARAALRAADEAVAAAQQALEQARQAAGATDATYTPIGEMFPSTSTGRRLALARWIAAAENPRTARVAVNHIWLRHFGEALVPTVENFGLNGAEPTNQPLLDWLASELVANGWRMKPLHRLIVLSSTYRLSSSPSSAEAAIAARNTALDPENRMLWRMNSRRMEAEVIRDSVLHTAGALDLTRGGPEIPESEALAIPRRSIYFRNTPNDKARLLELFDVADPNQCYRRRASVIPQQALALLNSGLALDQSRALAETVTSQAAPLDSTDSDAAFIRAAFECILTRGPTDAEFAACRRYLASEPTALAEPDPTVFPAGGQAQRAAASDPRQRARESLILVLFSHNDFVTIR